MSLTQTLEKINDFIERWMLGRNTERPDVIKFDKNNIKVMMTDSIRRFSSEKNLQDMDLSKLSATDRRKIGLALGRSLATDLVISFDTEHHDRR